MASVTYVYAYVGKNDLVQQMQDLEILKDDCSNAYACIVHDRDDAEMHTHLLFTSYKTISSIQELFDHKIYLEQVRNKVAYALYMLHRTDDSEKDGKFQYSVQDMFFSSKRFQNDLMIKDDEVVENSVNSKANILFDLLFDNHITTFAQYVRNAIDNNCYDELRRGSYLWKHLWLENHLYVGELVRDRMHHLYDNNNFSPKEGIDEIIENIKEVNGDNES